MDIKKFNKAYEAISASHNSKTHPQRKEACVYAAYWEITELIRAKRRAKEAYEKQCRDINAVIKNKVRTMEQLIKDKDTSFDPADFPSISPISYS